MPPPASLADPAAERPCGSIQRKTGLAAISKSIPFCSVAGSGWKEKTVGARQASAIIAVGRRKRVAVKIIGGQEGRGLFNR